MMVYSEMKIGGYFLHKTNPVLANDLFINSPYLNDLTKNMQHNKVWCYVSQNDKTINFNKDRWDKLWVCLKYEPEKFVIETEGDHQLEDNHLIEC